MKVSPEDEIWLPKDEEGSRDAETLPQCFSDSGPSLQLACGKDPVKDLIQRVTIHFCWKILLEGHTEFILGFQRLVRDFSYNLNCHNCSFWFSR